MLGEGDHTIFYITWSNSCTCVLVTLKGQQLYKDI